MEQPPSKISWPYPVNYQKEALTECDVLVLGGGIAGCWAAIGAAKQGVRVILVEKGATHTSGAGGSGCDHWESAATNPCSQITPEELTHAMIQAHGQYNNGISHYIECREGWDRLLDLESFGGKIRDTEDEFKGADFRDEATKLLFAYDYVNRFNLRVWGTTFKAALARECRRLGVQIIDRVMATGLLTKNGHLGQRITGATGVHCRTGAFHIFKARTVVLAMSRPTRIWLFSNGLPGISEFRPPQCTGDGHAMGWRAGVEFTMMEKSIKAEWSGPRSFPPYGTGNNHNTWYACSMVDARGRELPWVDRDGRVLENFDERYRPSPGQRFFLKGGGEPDFPVYDYTGPDTLPVDELLKQGYELPFYADLTSMPEVERKAIWGFMVGEEGKTKIPILKTYSDSGFNPETDWLQSYGTGWKSGAFLPQERQLFGIPGGILNDWYLRTNVEGLYAAGDQLFASNCHGHAAATGHYAGRHAASEAKTFSSHIELEKEQVSREQQRISQLIGNQQGITWQELNAGIIRIMQHHCGAVKQEELLQLGLSRLQQMEMGQATRLIASNPHELMRALEVQNILTNAQLVIHACLARKASAKHLHFHRSDFPELDPPDWHRFVTVKWTEEGVQEGSYPIDYFDDLKEKYEATNPEYAKDRGNE